MKKWLALFSIGAWMALLFPSHLLADDFDPTASFYISPSIGSLDSTFTFDASASYDQRGFSNTLEYRWNFEYSSTGFTEWSDEPVATYQYDEAGDKKVALEVRDEDGQTDRTYGNLTVYEDPVFSGEFDVDPLEGDTTTVFTFEADIATMGSFGIDDYQVRWDFDGDGDYDTDYEEGQIAYHTYSDANYYNPRMEILSPDGITLEVIGYDDNDEDETSYIYVGENDSPQASIHVYPTSSGTTSTTFYFDGSDSFDTDDHRDLEYRWDFEGDGIYDTDWDDDETNPTHQYDTPGTYSPTLQVRDSDDNTDKASSSITIDEDNFPPEAKFTINSDTGLTDDTVGTTSTVFTFNAGSSSDEEDYSSQLEFRWDFDGDGDYDTTFSDESRAEHTYEEPGTYTVTVEVMDTNSQTDTASQTVTIVENDAPIATFDISPNTGTPGITFSFDASEVSDSQYNTSSLEVRWDWEGDGTYDTAFEIDKTTTHQFDEAGTYEVTLQVRDPEGQTSTISQTLTVDPSTAPSAYLSVDESAGTFSTLFHFDASGSYDAETELDDLWFRWDFNYTGENDILFDTSWSRSETKTQYFDQTGDIMVRVEVKDEDGEVASATVTVHLHWASEFMDYLKDNGVIRGYTSLGGDLAPDQNVTRAELTKMAMEGADISESGHAYQGYFSDVSSTDWFDDYVEVAYEEDIISGYSTGEFRPNDAVNRAEGIKIILNAFHIDLEDYHDGTFSDVSSGDWFGVYVGTGYEYGLISGHSDGQFHPDWTMTRGEASKIIALAMQGGL